MGKGKNQRHNNSSLTARGNNSAGTDSSLSSSSTNNPRQTSLSFLTSPLVKLLKEEPGVILWFVLCILIGICLGLGIGTGYFPGGYGHPPTQWRIQLGQRIRNSFLHDTLHRGTAARSVLSPASDDSSAEQQARATAFPPFTKWIHQGDGGASGENTNYVSDISRALGDANSLWNRFSSNKLFGRGKSAPPVIAYRSHPQAFYTLREMIIREDHGYVHPDLGLLTPAPCGTERALGMVSSRYHECQVTCSRGTTARLSSPSSTNHAHDTNSTNSSGNDSSNVYQLPKGWYPQEEILLRIPLSIQITRATALKALRAILPVDVQRRAPLEDLDDAFLLALQLAHEHGRGRNSRFHAYIATFPMSSTCGYSPGIRASAMDMVASLGATYGLDVNGWPAEIHKAYEYAERISSSFARDYGSYITVAKNVKVLSLLQWSLCHVSSRAIAGRELNEDGIPVIGPTKKKSLRLVPMLDMINHDATAGLVQELYNDNEEGGVASVELEDGKHYSNVQESEHGTFIVRSMRHGKVLPLSKGQELFINYNVPEYSALDWFLMMAFVPPERMERWEKLDGVLPRVRVERPSVGVPMGNDNIPRGPSANRPEHEDHQEL